MYAEAIPSYIIKFSEITMKNWLTEITALYEDVLKPKAGQGHYTIAAAFNTHNRHRGACQAYKPKSKLSIDVCL